MDCPTNLLDSNKTPSWWDFFDSWEAAEEAWDAQASRAHSLFPLDIPQNDPIIPQIAAETARCLRWKALSWVNKNDFSGKLFRFFLQKPLKYLAAYARSILQRRPFVREGDFFYYGIEGFHEMQTRMQRDNTLLLVGFSYCEKPRECPCTRFSRQCIADVNNSVCQQCFIGKVYHALPRNRTVFLIVPTINSIGEEVVAIVETFPEKELLFLISSCEMALTMFADLGNMVGLRGMGVKLGGRICNTMKSFILSEKGIKPGMTWLSSESEKKMLSIVGLWRQCSRNHEAAT